MQRGVVEERIELEIYHRDCQYGFLIKEEGRVGE